MKPASDEKQNPRTTRVRRLILDAAIEVLLEHGAGEVTSTRIAEEAGVARTTIYRQWPDQASLVLATIDALVSPGRPLTESAGSVEADLTTSLSQLAYRMVHRQVLPIFGALLDYASRDEDFVAAQRRFLETLIWPTTEVLKWAQERGELPEHFDCSIAATVVTAPILSTYLLARQEVDDALIEQTVSQFVQLHVV